uniref:Uncharacterized protein n=1 Tax=Anguilla anguilla TaxID=7936 RepID=A0A0E9UIJ6_ANGAN
MSKFGPVTDQSAVDMLLCTLVYTTRSVPR